MPEVTDTNILIKDKHVADQYKGQMCKRVLDALVIGGPLKGVQMLISNEVEGEDEVHMASLESATLNVLVPDERVVNGWEIQAKVEIKVENVKMLSNVANMVKMSFIFEDNSDEMSPFVKEDAKWYKRIAMDIGVSSGYVNLNALKINAEEKDK